MVNTRFHPNLPAKSLATAQPFAPCHLIVSSRLTPSQACTCKSQTEETKRQTEEKGRKQAMQPRGIGTYSHSEADFKRCQTERQHAPPPHPLYIISQGSSGLGGSRRSWLMMLMVTDNVLDNSGTKVHSITSCWVTLNKLPNNSDL